MYHSMHINFLPRIILGGTTCPCVCNMSMYTVRSAVLEKKYSIVDDTMSCIVVICTTWLPVCGVLNGIYILVIYK